MTTITFTGDNAGLVAKGLKTQTRRIVSEKDIDKLLLDAAWKYKVGDKLAVREPWKIVSWYCDDAEIRIRYKDGQESNFIHLDEIDVDESTIEKYLIQCTDDCLKAGLVASDGYFPLHELNEPPTRWRSPRFMPKWASRMTIEVTGIRVERLQEISEEDARAEGIMKITKDETVYKYCVYDKGDYSSVPWSEMPQSAKEAYKNIWEKINGKGSWDLNPHVWVITFQLIKQD